MGYITDGGYEDSSHNKENTKSRTKSPGSPKENYGRILIASAKGYLKIDDLDEAMH